MPYSLWEYLRERTRDAVLAGFQDALDIVEQQDTNGSQHDQAKRLMTTLGASVLGTSRGLPSPSVNGHVHADDVVFTTTPAQRTPPKAPQRPANASAFDDQLQERLEAAAAQEAVQTPPAQAKAGRKRRGRPKKQDQAKQ